MRAPARIKIYLAFSSRQSNITGANGTGRVAVVPHQDSNQKPHSLASVCNHQRDATNELWLVSIWAPFDVLIAGWLPQPPSMLFRRRKKSTRGLTLRLPFNCRLNGKCWISFEAEPALTGTHTRSGPLFGPTLLFVFCIPVASRIERANRN